MNTKNQQEELALRRLESSLKAADPAKRRDFNEKLFASIMEEVKEVKPYPRWVTIVYKRESWVAAAAAVVAVVSLWMVSAQNNQSVYVVQQSAADKEWIVDSTVQDPLLLQDTVNNHKNEENLVFDTLALKMDKLSDEELQIQIDELLK